MELNKLIVYLFLSILNFLNFLYFILSSYSIQNITFAIIANQVVTLYFIFNFITSMTGGPDLGDGSFKRFCRTTLYQICLIVSGGVFSQILIFSYGGFLFGFGFFYGLNALYLMLLFPILYIEHWIFEKEQGDYTPRRVALLTLLYFVVIVLGLSSIIISIKFQLNFFKVIWLVVGYCFSLYFAGIGAYTLGYLFFAPREVTGIDNSSGYTAQTNA